jgi:O-antigen/teichoic acid export membrane protein
MSPKDSDANDPMAGVPDPAPDAGGEATGKRSKKKKRAAEGSRYGKVAKRGVVWSFFREGVSEMITTPTAMIMARLLSPFDFGIAASAGFFLTLATRLTNFGFNLALVRVKDLRPEHSSSVFVISLGVGLCAYGILVASAGLMADFFRAPQVAQVIPIAALTFLISPFGTVPSALMTRNMEFKRTAAADWISSLGEAAAAIGFALAGYGFWSIVYGRVIGDLISTGAKMALGRWALSFRFSLSAARELFAFGSGVFVKRLLDYTANSVDNLVVGRALGVTALGFYDKAFMTMSKVLVRVNRGGPMVSFRVFAIIHEEPERFRRAYQKVVLATSLVSYPVLIGLAAAATEVMGVLYGERWLPATTAFQVLCIAGSLKVINEYAGMAAQASGRVWNQVWRQTAYTVLIVVGVGVGSRWGLTGAAAGVLAATVGMTVLMNGLLVSTTAISLSTLLGAQVPGLLAAACVGGAVLLTRAAMPGKDAQWELLLAEALTGAIGYAMFLKFNRFREVRTLIRDTADDLSPSLGRVVRLVS